MVQFEIPEFTVKVGRFNAIIRTSYAEESFGNDGPTAYATAEGDAQNFVCTAGHVETVFELLPDGSKGRVVGFRVTEKWGGEAAAQATELFMAIAYFGVAVAAQLR